MIDKRPVSSFYSTEIYACDVTFYMRRVLYDLSSIQRVLFVVIKNILDFIIHTTDDTDIFSLLNLINSRKWEWSLCFLLKFKVVL